jgi:hypothetical protein
VVADARAFTEEDLVRAGELARTVEAPEAQADDQKEGELRDHDLELSRFRGRFGAWESSGRFSRLSVFLLVLQG